MDILEVQIKLNGEVIIRNGVTISDTIKKEKDILETLLLSYFKERGMQVREKMNG